jgi:integrase
MPAEERPDKPYPDFPLFPHRNGQWAKKIRGKLRYFGTWYDSRAALELYQLQRDALFADEEPPLPGGEVSVKELCDSFLEAKELLIGSGDLTQRSFDDYLRTCKRMAVELGRTRAAATLQPASFDKLRASLAKTLGPVALGNEINRVRIVFRYAFEAGLLGEQMRFGPNFKRPSARSMRLERARRGSRLFTVDELHAALDHASVQLRAMILLGVNCGLGNSDLGRMRRSNLDLAGRWLNYPRHKTGIDRRARLWTETVRAIRDVLKARPAPRREENSDLVFVTRYGGSWYKAGVDDPISKEMIKCLTDAGVRRPGLSFYALRHTFQTIGEECGDLVAVKAIMGHAPQSGDMSAVYRQRISDDRLIHVANHIHRWLFAKRKTRLKVS